MKGNEMLFSDFVEGHRTQYIIPVYQRNYDWLLENCEQLFKDLIILKDSSRKTHFFGSIVTALADGYGNNRLVIDGQQRLTTISLLLLAGIKAVKNKEITIKESSKIDEAFDVFLNAKYCSSERKIKLVPIDKDKIAYDKIFNNEEKLVSDSKITRNFLYFYNLLTKKPQTFSFDELIDTIEKLQIISIQLDYDDDPQLIFESLNSTGLALTEADKIRNYLLMSLSADEQEEYFKNYWQKIEEATDNQPTKFLRDYLTIKQQLVTHVRLSNIYQEWKKYMDKKDRKSELVEMLDYARYYKQITHNELSSKKLSEKMKHICNIETDVSNVFFIQYLRYATQNQFSENEIFKVIDLIENYLARRIVCNIPGNALTYVFCSLHKDVMKSMDEYQNAGIKNNSNYFDILTYHIMRRDGNYQLPRDTQFKEAIERRDAYHMIKPFQIFLFERLENSIPGEFNDVASDMKKKIATIEHIMPQTLNSAWMEMLGKDYQKIQDNYLHTFANLTLTGINSELSNNAFEIKRDGKKIGTNMFPGYKDSKYRLTKDVTNCKKWTEKELKQRALNIENIFLRLYPLPSTSFTPLPKPIDEVFLDDESFSPTNRVLKGFSLFGDDYVETKWKGMLIKVISLLVERYPEIISTLYSQQTYLFTEENYDPLYCVKIDNSTYLYTNMDNKSKLRCIKYFFEKCNIAESELTIKLEPSKSNS